MAGLVGTQVLAGLVAAAGFTDELLTGDAVIAPLVALAAVGLVITGSWGRPAALVVPLVVMWVFILPVTVWAIVDAWRHPLPSDFVSIGGMDGIGQDKNNEAVWGLFTFVALGIASLLLQSAALVVGALIRRIEPGGPGPRD